MDKNVLLALIATWESRTNQVSSSEDRFEEGINFGFKNAAKNLKDLIMILEHEI